VVNEFWQKAASPSCHPSRLRMDSSDRPCIPSNTCFLMPTWVSSPNGISIVSAVFRTMLQMLPMLVSGANNSQNCPSPSRDQHLNVIYGSLGPPNSAPQTASRSVQPFSQCSRTWPTDTHTQTDRQTGRPRYSVFSNRLLSLVIAAMWPGTITN